jgi:hypothetical protein
MSVVKEAVQVSKQQKQLQVKGNFLWPLELIDISVRVPVEHNQESFRAIEHIPPEEIQMAMLVILDHAAGLSTASLITETARLFGYNRTGNKIGERLKAQIKALLNKNSIIQNGDYLTLHEQSNLY